MIYNIKYIVNVGLTFDAVSGYGTRPVIFSAFGIDGVPVVCRTF